MALVAKLNPRVYGARDRHSLLWIRRSQLSDRRKASAPLMRLLPEAASGCVSQRMTSVAGSEVINYQTHRPSTLTMESSRNLHMAISLPARSLSIDVCPLRRLQTPDPGFVPPGPTSPLRGFSEYNLAKQTPSLGQKILQNPVVHFSSFML